MKLLPDQSNEINRQQFFAAQRLTAVVSAQVANSEVVQLVTPSDANKIMPDTDGLVTAYRDLFLTVTVADCFPVYFFDPEQQVIGLCHAGWRGIAGGVIGNTVRLLSGNCGCRPSNLLCWVGPGILQHHFEVKPDVADKFADYPQCIDVGQKLLVDLPGIISQQLFNFGVPTSNISVSEDCTYCLDDKYFSFRRDQAEPVEAMLGYIGMI